MEPRTQPACWKPWVRLIVVLSIGLVVLVPVLLVVAWSRFAGGRFGWVSSLVTFGLLGFAIGWVAVTRRWDTARKIVSITLAVVAGVLGIFVAHFAPPTEGRLRHEIEALAHPSWHLARDTVDGSWFCFDACLSVTREYRVDAPAEDVLADLSPRLANRDVPSIGSVADRWNFADRDGG